MPSPQPAPNLAAAVSVKLLGIALGVANFLRGRAGTNRPAEGGTREPENLALRIWQIGWVYTATSEKCTI
jgi:hypothetical protein